MSATLAATGMRDSLVYDTVQRWSVGVNAQWMERDMKPDGGGADIGIESTTVSLFVGYDVQDWLMVYGTAGETEARKGNAGDYSGSDFKFSIGVQANLWQTEVMDPSFMAGVLTFKGLAEVSRYSFGGGDSGIDGSWNELLIACPFSYEVFSERRDLVDSISYSLVVSLGPAISLVEGSVSTRGTYDDFTASNVFGFIGGVDVYISHNLSVGCQVEYFDKTTLTASAVFHF